MGLAAKPEGLPWKLFIEMWDDGESDTATRGVKGPGEQTHGSCAHLDEGSKSAVTSQLVGKYGEAGRAHARQKSPLQSSSQPCSVLYQRPDLEWHTRKALSILLP